VVLVIIDRNRRIKSQRVLGPEIVRNFPDGVRKLFVGSGEKSLGSGIVRKPPENISRVVDLAAIDQRQLLAGPAEKRLLILAKITDRVNL